MALKSATDPGTDRPIDRIAPTRRPAGRPVMLQRWRRLLFLHWPVPVAMLRPLLPAELEIDAFDGVAYVGLVPFTMLGVRPIWSPSVPSLSNFHETNVRTYVHCGGSDPGVWFFSLDAANALAVRLARAFWRLPYHFARMSLECAPEAPGNAAGRPIPGVGTSIDYRTERLWPGPLPASCRVRYTPIGAPAPSTPGTIEHFLAERYLLYTAHGGRLFRGQVHHTPYPLQPARVDALDENLVAAAGITHENTPPMAHYASGVDVEIFGLRTVAATSWS